MKLVEMEPPALAKSWSMVDFLVSEHREKVMPWLMAVCDESGDGRTDLQRLRPRTEAIFAVDADRDVYAVLDAQWREYASRVGAGK